MQGNVVHDILAMIAVEALRAHDVVGIQSGKNFFLVNGCLSRFQVLLLNC